MKYLFVWVMAVFWGFSGLLHSYDKHINHIINQADANDLNIGIGTILVALLLLKDD